MKQKIHNIYGKDIFSPIHGYPTKIREKYLYPRLKLRYYKNRLKYGKAAPNSFEIIYIDPDDINKIIIPGFFREDRYTSRIKNGEWDSRDTKTEKSARTREILDLEERSIYTSFKQRFESDFEWKDTERYQKGFEQIRETGSWKDHSSIESLSSTLNSYDSLYANIKKDGYKTQKELGETVLDEVLIDIGRDGKLILEDGRHRVIISKILKLQKIPVRVLVRHKKWQEKRAKILNDGTSSNEKLLNHPDILQTVSD